MIQVQHAPAGFPALQPDTGTVLGQHYLPSRPDTVLWGRLPCATDKPVLTVSSGSTVTIDTVSHEGILEDQGRDPRSFFGAFGVPKHEVLQDAVDIAAGGTAHLADHDGPHIVTGPIAVSGAQPGDILAIEVLDLQVRCGYGVISNRHGRGALPEEFPVSGTLHSVFATAHPGEGGPYGCIPLPGDRDERMLRFPLRPFLGVMGVAPAGPVRPHSVPPGPFGGNIDIRLLGKGATLYVPVEAEGALFYAGDPHFSQGDGEVALTAFEAPLRATVRLTVLPVSAVAARRLHAATAELLIPIGLHVDLAEAMRECVRCALDLLEGGYGIDRPTAYAYLSAAADFSVSQVVDRVTGIHGLIRKSDLPAAPTCGA